MSNDNVYQIVFLLFSLFCTYFKNKIEVMYLEVILERKNKGDAHANESHCDIS
jgi:uncharacterized membrane protein